MMKHSAQALISRISGLVWKIIAAAAFPRTETARRARRLATTAGVACFAIAALATAPKTRGLVTPDAVTASAVIPKGGALPMPAKLTQGGRQRRIESEIITVLPDGFEPSKITLRHKQFFLIVDNRSGVENVALSLDREVGENVKEVSVQRDQLDWSGMIDLPPGSYRLTEANHSEWVCRITVTPN